MYICVFCVSQVLITITDPISINFMQLSQCFRSRLRYQHNHTTHTKLNRHNNIGVHIHIHKTISILSCTHAKYNAVYSKIHQHTECGPRRHQPQMSSLGYGDMNSEPSRIHFVLRRCPKAAAKVQPSNVLLSSSWSDGLAMVSVCQLYQPNDIVYNLNLSW